jgi:hypothetical protein
MDRFLRVPLLPKERAMILNKRQLFTVVAMGGAGFITVLAARKRARWLEVERRKLEELQKWEGEGGNAPSPLAKIPA